MSINVNVHGNPVNIRRGPAIIYETDSADKEFHNRRKIRLEQVRQQSKDIAEDLRNRIRKLKDTKATQFQHKADKELDEWKEKKLAALQKQYCDCLKDLELDFNNEATDDDENVQQCKKNVHTRVALDRTQRAVNKHLKGQAPLNKPKKKKPKARRSLEMSFKEETVKTDEHPRSYLNPQKPPPSPSPVSDSESDSVLAQLKTIRKPPTDEGDQVNSYTETVREPTCCKSVQCSPCLDPNMRFVVPLNIEKSGAETSRDVSPPPANKRAKSPKSPKKKKTKSKSPTKKTSNMSPKKADKCTKPDASKMDAETQCEQQQGTQTDTIETIPDTRISDRIKCRCYKPDDMHGLDHCCDLYDACAHSKPRDIPTAHASRPRVREPSIGASAKPSTLASCPHCARIINKHDEIPAKPAINLINIPETIDSTACSKNCSSEVRYYDHKNRFERKYVTDNANVKKIPAESLQIIDSDNSDIDFARGIYQNEKNALNRGKKAMAKINVKNNYKQLMQQLPLLEKQERLATLSTNKDKFHMSEQRRKEQEQKKQKQMDKAYEKLFPPTKPLITIQPKIPQTKMKSPCKSATVNVGTWDATKTKTFQNKRTETPPASDLDRSDRLIEMLADLTEQRNKLLSELCTITESKTKSKVMKDIAQVDKLIVTAQAKKSQTKAKSTKSLSSEEEPKQLKVIKTSPKRPVTISRTTQCTDPVKSKSPSPTRSPKKKVQVKPRPQSVSETTSASSDQGKSHLGTCACSCASAVKSCEPIPIPSTSTQLPPTSYTCTCELSNNISLEELCEIRIRLNEKGPPQVCVNPKCIQDKEITANVIEKPKICADACVQAVDYSDKTTSKRTKTNKIKHVVGKKKSKKAISWKEQFSLSSSTSYCSPPGPRSNLCNFKQIPTNSKQTNEFNMNMMKMIKKLLAMSRKSVEDLHVSSVSEVSTPSSSILNVPSNNPVKHLQSILNFLQNNVEGEHACAPLSSRTETPRTPSSGVKCKCTSSGGKCMCTPSVGVKCKCGHTVNECACASKLNAADFDKYSTDNYPKVLTAYNKLAENCARKIENLTAMIEQVRCEKVSMMQNTNGSGSDKENSTRYYDLPEMTKGNQTSPPLSPEQQKLNEHLLNIDYDYKGTNTQTSSINEGDLNESEKEMRERFQKLIDVDKDKIVAMVTTKTDPIYGYEQLFIPLLSDIPKLPKLEETKQEKIERPRPPPSKGLNSAKRFNNAINNSPHELSTIIEADSMQSVRSPEKREIPPPPPMISETSKSSEPDILEGLSLAYKQKKVGNGNSDASFNESMETLLKKMGMGWAVSTLKKTQDALALSSSTSETSQGSKVVLSSSGSNCTSTSSSEISLRDFLARQFLTKLSPFEGSDSADTSTRFMRDLEHSISAMHASTGSKRTSTPVQKDEDEDTD